MNIAVILMGVAVLCIAVVQILQARELKELRGLVNTLVAMAYADAKKQGKTTGDIIQDILKAVMQDAETQRSGE